MKGTVKLTGIQKAVFGAIYDQSLNHTTSFFEYDILEAMDYLKKTGELAKYNLHVVKRHFEVLQQIGQKFEAIDPKLTTCSIRFSQNEEDEDGNYVVDTMYSELRLTEDADDRLRQKYDIRVHFATVYIILDPDFAKRLKAENEGNYTIKLEFENKYLYRYKVTCIQTGKSYHYHLHDGRLPHLIIKKALEHSKDANPTVTKEDLNRELYSKQYESGKWVIPEEKPIGSEIFRRHKPLKYFFDMQAQSITYLGNTAEGLSQADIDELEDTSDSDS